MTRNEVINKVNKMALELSKSFNREDYDVMFDMIYDWNREHEDNEIFSCEEYDEDEDANKFYIEDNYYFFR